MSDEERPKRPRYRQTDLSDVSGAENAPDPEPPAKKNREIGGPKGPEPTRFGDWESKGRCIDF